MKIGWVFGETGSICEPANQWRFGPNDPRRRTRIKPNAKAVLAMKKCYFCGVGECCDGELETAYVKKYRNGIETSSEPFEGAKKVLLCGACR